MTYANRWADAINETYDAFAADNYLDDWDLEDGSDYDDAVGRILSKAAQCLRNGIPATFTAGELDLVRHLMPAHVVHQSRAVRWVLQNYETAQEDEPE